MHTPSFFKGAQLYALSFLVGCHFCLVALKGIKPSLHSQCRYLSVGRSISHWRGRPCTLHPNMGCFPVSLPLHLVGLACHDPVQWVVHSSFGSLSASINGYRRLPSALCMCSSRGLQPNHLTCGLHPSSVDAPVDVHDPSCNFPFFHPWEAFVIGHWVITMPSCSCGIIFSSPHREIVLQGVGLVHLSHVWWLPIHRGTPTSDTTRRSQFWWRTHDHPCWFVTL